MRRLLILVLVLAAGAALAQSGAALAQQRPPKLEPLPEPPPPPGLRDPGAEEPRVRIAPAEGDRVEEVRDGGRIVMIKVTPPGGTPYYLVDPGGTGNWTRGSASSLDDGVRVPMWSIITF